MNAKLRIRTAMDLGSPDRIPIMCQFSIGHMLQQLRCSPAEFWFDPETFVRGLITLRALYDFDGILISLHGHNPNWRDDVQSRTIRMEAEEVVWKDGHKTICYVDDLPREISTTKRPRPTMEGLVISELPQTLDYIPVSQDLHFLINPDHCFDIFKKIVTEVGSTFSVHGEITSPLDYVLDYFGYEAALMALIEYPERSREVLLHFTTLVKCLAEQMCDTGVDALKLSSPFAGSGFISPVFYSEFVLPFEREIVHAVKNKGVHIYIHTCGAIGDRLELMLASGTSGLECLDPPPLGNVELEDAVRITQGKAFIKGNIDSVNLLLRGTDDDIIADAHRRINIGKKSGGYILSTACSIAPRVRKEKLLLLREAVEWWG